MGEDDVSAFVLAGGKSTRMGSDKAFLELHGRTLLDRALKLASEVARTVFIVGDQKKFAKFGSVVEDVYRERGPLGGIHAALLKSTTEFNFMLGVDLPFVEKAFVEYLLARARETSAVVTVAHVDDRFQPLCAVYKKGFGELAERALEDGRNKIDPLFSEVKTEIVGLGELLQQGFSAAMFRNLNTREDLEQAGHVTTNSGRIEI